MSRILAVLVALFGFAPWPFSCSSQVAADIRPLWSVTLADETSGFPNTSSTFEATRRIAIVANRVVVVFDVGPIVPNGTNIQSTYRLVSLDAMSGAIKNQLESKGARVPDLYATDSDHVVIGEYDLELLNPDLTSTGVEFKEPSHGRTINISPDGSVMAHEIHPGSELLDTQNLRPNGIHLTEGVPTSVSRKGVVTNNTYWYRDYPKDKSFVTLTTSDGQRLLYHGSCGDRPAFLTNDLVIVTGCGKMFVVSVSTGAVKEAKLSDRDSEFAGVSRDGSRFAIRSEQMRGFDPRYVRSERFTIYDTAQLTPIGLIRSQQAPDEASWSAFSADGKLFVSGSEKLLSLYRLP